jgi:hypothetical protein
MFAARGANDPGKPVCEPMALPRAAKWVAGGSLPEPDYRRSDWAVAHRPRQQEKGAFPCIAPRLIRSTTG